MALNAVTITEIEEDFVPQTQGCISDSITQNWTEQAVECYKLKGNCSCCSIAKGNYSFVCQMPKVLEVLKKTLGEPSENNLKLKLIKK